MGTTRVESLNPPDSDDDSFLDSVVDDDDDLVAAAASSRIELDSPPGSKNSLSDLNPRITVSTESGRGSDSAEKEDDSGGSMEESR